MRQWQNTFSSFHFFFFAFHTQSSVYYVHTTVLCTVLSHEWVCTCAYCVYFCWPMTLYVFFFCKCYGCLLSKYNVLYNLVTLNIYLWKQNKSDLLALLSVLPFSCISRWTIPCLSISFTVSAFFLCVYSCYIWICFLLFFLNLFYMKLLL